MNKLILPVFALVSVLAANLYDRSYEAARVPVIVITQSNDMVKRHVTMVEPTPTVDPCTGRVESFDAECPDTATDCSRVCLRDPRTGAFKVWYSREGQTYRVASGTFTPTVILATR